MQRFRSSWIALMGGALLVTLSVSAAFGANPSAAAEGTRGQTIAGFVHELVFGSNAESETEESESDESEEEGQSEEAEELEQELFEDVEAAGAHGECVSEVAQDPEAVGGPNDNHGGAVSEAARVTCRETDDTDGEPLTDEEEAAETEELEEANAHGACVSEVAQDPEAVGGPNDNHGGAVSEAARVTCWEDASGAASEVEASAEGDGDAEELSAKEQRKAERVAARANRGSGHGRGGGR